MRKSNRLAGVIVTVILTALSGCVNVGDDDGFDFGGFALESADVVGSGVVEEEDRSVSGFTEVVLAGEGTLRIKQGTAEELIVRAEDNLLPHILTTVQDGVLEIRTQSNVDLEPSQPIEYDLTVVALESVFLSGVGDVEVTNLDADELDVTLSGVGNVDIAGTVDEQRVTITGLGEYDARNLSSRQAVISISNQTATVRVSGTLTVTITGNGMVFYIGDPAVDADITGSGSVQKIP